MTARCRASRSRAPARARARAATSIRVRCASRRRGAGAARRKRRARRSAAHGEALADPRHWYLNGSWLLQGAARLMLVRPTSCPSRGTRASGWPGRRSRSPPMGWARQLGSAQRRRACPTRLGPRAAIYVACGPTAPLPCLAAALDPHRAGVLLASVALFGAGFAAADTMVVKVVPGSRSACARSAPSWASSPWAGAAGPPRWARRRRGSPR